MAEEVLNPTLMSLLKAFRLDLEFVKGDGSLLYDAEGNAYLDFIAQYGAVPFGYNPPEIWEAVEEFKQSLTPALVQPSMPIKARNLAALLAEITPGNLQYTTFCQSGAEAVEIAIKLARSSKKKPGIIAMDGGFHGKTLGALSATGRTLYQKPFFAPAPYFSLIPFNDLDALERKLWEEKDSTAAVIMEPIQGEGGIRVPDRGTLQAVKQLCSQYGVLMILDEIQTGLGRTGFLFACQEEGVEPDILLLAKALGGGIVPLGACIAAPEAWNEDFGRLHSSTFANNNFACTIGEASVKKLLKNDRSLIKDVAKKGELLLGRLREIQRKYPGIIKEVRGRGLLAGVEFFAPDGSESFSLKFMEGTGGFSALLSSYLLYGHKLRVAPFLNNPMTLRLEPTLTISETEIVRAVGAIENLCRLLYYRDYAKLYYPVLDIHRTVEDIRDCRFQVQPVVSSVLQRDEAPEKKFAFIIHYPDKSDVVANNASFDEFADEEINRFLDWEAQFSGETEVVCHLPAIRSACGEVAEGWLIGVPLDSRQMLEMPRQEAVKAIEKAVDKAKELGAGIVGLGALTSSVTHTGIEVTGRGIAVTSGNGFTVAMAIEALLKGAEKMQIVPSQAIGAVVGANGSIGRICSLLLSGEVGELILIGNVTKGLGSVKRLNIVAEEIYAYAIQRMEKGEVQRGISGKINCLLAKLRRKDEGLAAQINKRIASYCGKIEREENCKTEFAEVIKEVCAVLGESEPVKITLNPAQLKRANMIITATNSSERIIHPEFIREGAVICDVARPPDVGKEVRAVRKDILVIEGGVVQFPEPVCFGKNMGYRAGVNLACLSETMLLALEGHFQDNSIGRISVDDVNYLRKLAKKHGFKLAGFRKDDGEIPVMEDQLETESNECSVG